MSHDLRCTRCERFAPTCHDYHYYAESEESCRGSYVCEKCRKAMAAAPAGGEHEMCHCGYMKFVNQICTKCGCAAARGDGEPS